MQTQRILIISHERVGPQMAGPGIRCWEFARVLANEFQVTLAAPASEPIVGEGFEVLPYQADDRASLAQLEKAVQDHADVVVASGYLLRDLAFLRKLQAPIVADVYIPVAVESLAWNAHAAAGQQVDAYRFSWQVTQCVAQQADFLICASERQRDFWLGVLAAHGRLHPTLYAADRDLCNLIDVVPFGCPASPPRGTPVLRGVLPGIGPRDRVIVWGGGVWNWLDPLTLLRAMPQILVRHPTARLVFLGADHPDRARVPEMEQARQARALSQELGLEGRSVFWLGWVPYAERGAYLLESDVGVSLHRSGVEVRLAFRTRLLDAIWAGLPMVLTGGDTLSAEFERWGLGHVIETGNAVAVAEAVSAVLDEPDARSARQSGFDRLRPAYHWERVVQPLALFCRAPQKGVGKPSAEEYGTAAMNGVTAEARRAGFAAAPASSSELGGPVGAPVAGVRDDQAEIARLQAIVQGYESGRLMRVLAAAHRLRRRLWPR
jgi:glycosyltransferase involved in cell wall biosynthesis